MKLRIVTGKGGVGKTRTSLLLARRYPESQLWEQGFGIEEEAERQKLPSPPALRTSSSQLLETFLLSSIKIKPIARWISQNRFLLNIFEIAPNLDELLQFHEWKTL